MRHGGLAHAIDRFGRQRHESGLGAHADDPAVSLLDHHAPYRLAGEEDALHVHVEGEVEVLLDHLLGRSAGAEAGIVYEDVQPAKRIDRLVDRRTDLLQPAHVHLHGERSAAHALDLCHQVIGGTRLAQAQHHIRPGVGESQRDRAPDTAGGAGDERGLAGEVEAWEGGVNLGDHENPP